MAPKKKGGISKKKNGVFKKLTEHPGKAVKTFLGIGFLIGFLWFLVEIFKFGNSAIGKIIKNLLGDMASLLAGLGNAADAAGNILSKCTGGEDSKGKSVSKGTQVGNCFGIIGIILGAVFVIPLLGKLAQGLGERAKDAWSKKSEIAKENESETTDNLKEKGPGMLEENTENISETLQEKGMPKDQADEIAADLAEKILERATAKALEDGASDAAAKTNNQHDAESAAELEEKGNSIKESTDAVIDQTEMSPEDQQEIKDKTDEIADNDAAELGPVDVG